MAKVPSDADRAGLECAPFFVVGAMRSGTTLLRLMLASHPRLAIPPESHFLAELLEFEEFAGGLAGNRDTVVNWLISHRRLADLKLGPDWMRSTLLALEPFTSRSIASALFSEYARREGKPRWGDKTPRYRSFIPQLHGLFPEAKFIHVMRDGRDTALSAWRAKFGPKTWAAAVFDWRDSVRDAWKGAEGLGQEAFLQVRYEDLLCDPESVLASICAFLGEEYHAEMLQFSEIARREVPPWEAAWHAKLEQPLDPENKEKWKTGLKPEQIVLFERVAGKELVAAGYPRANVPFGASVRAKAFWMQSGHVLKTPLVRLILSLRSKSPLDRAR